MPAAHRDRTAGTHEPGPSPPDPRIDLGSGVGPGPSQSVRSGAGSESDSGVASGAMTGAAVNIDEFRAMGHRVVDVLADHLASIEDRPLFSTILPRDVNALFDEPVPVEGEPADAVLDELEQKLLPHVTQVTHPGYMGLITPTPLPVGAIGDFIASALNQNVGTYSLGPAAVAIERRTVRWLNDLVGYPRTPGSEAGGSLTSGGTMANFVGLKLARDFATGNRAQHEGLSGRFAVYMSDQRQVSCDKAVDAVGIGREGMRLIATNDRYEIDVDALEAAIAKDRADGIRGLCIIAMAGTTNTGSVDDLRALRAIADREGMWLHVDAAYGGGMLLSHDPGPACLAGLAMADSITLDPHKWFFAPVDAGAILVRDGAQLTRSFGMQPPYLKDEFVDGGGGHAGPDMHPGVGRSGSASSGGGASGGGGVSGPGERYQYYVHSFEQSRRFRGLKVWMSLKRYGTAQIGRWIDANIKQARHLHALVEASADFTAACAPVMSAVCVRYQPPGSHARSDAPSPLRERVGVRVGHGEGEGASASGSGGRSGGRSGGGGDLDEAAIGRIHHEVARRIEQGGRFWFGTTLMKDKWWFRINPVNFRTTIAHMDELFETLKRECGEVSRHLALGTGQ